MESDADRLASIKDLGGLRVRHDSGELWGIFNPSFISLGGGGMEIESRSPALTCRSSDVKDLPKGTALSIDGEPAPFRISRPERDEPAPGFTTLILRA